MLPEKLHNVAQRILLVEHLKSLNEEDRYMRFGYLIRDDQIEKYVERSYGQENETSQWFGIFDDEGLIIASLHVVMVTSKKAEMGCSVNPDQRNQGIGQILFERGLVWARANGAKTIYMQCLSQNAAMQKIAKRNGMLVATMAYNEKEGKLEFPNTDITAPYSDIIIDRIAAVDATFRNQRNMFTKIINVWTKKD